ncbi:hypothetical protein [Pedobacter gandavensis]|uniref:XRE family transcriptional regulator n=1 Tax=Pedobacter gandavensis TaxID=2679963 RepID=A0ABR6EW04_9SPHI|nr:hypothetical protein [Pedobacter gandavensis]MBB2149146.1 hypothetical protein [Pedobacter gandavensis]
MEMHIGELIKAKAKERKKSTVELADELGTGRRNMYKILDSNDILVSQLWKLSKMLEFNFFELFNPLHPNGSKGPSEEISKEKSLLNKNKKHEFTFKIEVKYSMDDANNLGAFVTQVNDIGEQLGFKLT